MKKCETFDNFKFPSAVIITFRKHNIGIKVPPPKKKNKKIKKKTKKTHTHTNPK